MVYLESYTHIAIYEGKLHIMRPTYQYSRKLFLDSECLTGRYRETTNEFGHFSMFVEAHVKKPLPSVLELEDPKPKWWWRLFRKKKQKPIVLDVEVYVDELLWIPEDRICFRRVHEVQDIILECGGS